MHGGGSAPSCCAFTHRVAFEEVSGHRVLIKSGPENRSRSARGTSQASAGRGIHGGGAPPSLPSRLLTSANPRSRPGEGAPNQKLGQRKPKPGYRPVLGEVMQGGPCSWSVSLEAPLSLEPASGGPMVSSGLCGPSHIPRPGTLVGRQPPVNRTDVNWGQSIWNHTGHQHEGKNWAGRCLSGPSPQSVCSHGRALGRGAVSWS